MTGPKSRNDGTWSAVRARSAGTCDCTGQCGRDHRVCSSPMSIVSPRGGLPAHRAATTPVVDLLAWCRACWASLIERAAADSTTEPLF